VTLVRKSSQTLETLLLLKAREYFYQSWAKIGYLEERGAAFLQDQSTSKRKARDSSALFGVAGNSKILLKQQLIFRI